MTEESLNESLPSPEEMKQLLWAHADTTAERIIEQLGSPVSMNNLTQFLEEEGCLRYFTTLRFSDEGLEPEQFAQPVFYTENGGQRCMLHIHPRYQNYPEAVPFLVAYMAAVIMYRDTADSDLCEHLGAMLVKQEKNAFYELICTLADWRPTNG